MSRTLLDVQAIKDWRRNSTVGAYRIRIEHLRVVKRSGGRYLNSWKKSQRKIMKQMFDEVNDE